MKKTNRIRLSCILAAACCCMAYGGGYYYSTKQPEGLLIPQFNFEDAQSEEGLPQTAQSLTVLSPYKFVLCEEEGYVIVYCADRETVYDTTDIRIEELPTNLQAELQEGKLMYSEQELYNFLESYSS